MEEALHGLAREALEGHRCIAAARTGLPACLLPLLHAFHQSALGEPQPEKPSNPTRQAAVLVAAALPHAAAAEAQVDTLRAVSCFVDCRYFGKWGLLSGHLQPGTISKEGPFANYGGFNALKTCEVLQHPSCCPDQTLACEYLRVRGCAQVAVAQEAAAAAEHLQAVLSSVAKVAVHALRQPAATEAAHGGSTAAHAGTMTAHAGTLRADGGRGAARGMQAAAIYQRFLENLQGRSGQSSERRVQSGNQPVVGAGEQPLLGVSDQVSLLIKEATSLDNLAQMYEGWSAWI